MVELVENKYSKELSGLEECTQCPHECKANRFTGKLGYCKTDAGFNISSICLHRGEEPVISGKYGICNIFFSHCNLQCIYCQNYQISRNSSKSINKKYELPEIIEEIKWIFDKGCNSIGFVSPSHNIIQMKIIIEELKLNGYNPITIFNTNAYDKVETIRELDGLIDVYLPDFKYSDSDLALKFSGVKDYTEIAIQSISEMYRQKGSNLIINDDGEAESGLIIRHLVFPGHIDNSISALREIADKISTSVHISLMSQYHPITRNNKFTELNREINREEYQLVIDEMESLGFYKGWVQELDSPTNYQPDFERVQPFEQR
jgi:putative pyruvate formate lyase activating enzyme